MTPDEIDAQLRSLVCGDFASQKMRIYRAVPWLFTQGEQGLTGRVDATEALHILAKLLFEADPYAKLAYRPMRVHEDSLFAGDEIRDPEDLFSLRTYRCTDETTGLLEFTRPTQWLGGNFLSGWVDYHCEPAEVANFIFVYRKGHRSLTKPL